MKKVILFKSPSEEYEKAFTDKGFEVKFVEPLQFTYINTEVLNEKLHQSYDGLILTSPRAIEAVAKCWDPTKFALWKSRKIYTVGDASFEKISQLLGIEAQGASSGNAENLAKIIIRENLASSKFFFPCGNLRSEILPNLLQSANIVVDPVTVYVTNQNDNLLKNLIEVNDMDNEIQCLVFFSPSGCEYVHRQLQTLYNKLSKVPHFAIGNSTAHKIENFGKNVAGIAAKPKADSLVETIQKYFASH